MGASIAKAEFLETIIHITKLTKPNEKCGKKGSELVITQKAKPDFGHAQEGD